MYCYGDQFRNNDPYLKRFARDYFEISENRLLVSPRKLEARLTRERVQNDNEPSLLRFLALDRCLYRQKLMQEL